MHFSAEPLAICAVSLALFTWCAFYVVRLSTKIRRALEQQHPEILSKISPRETSSWHEHWVWQNDVNVVAKTYPLLRSGIDDDILRDVANHKLFSLVAAALLLATAFFFVRAAQ